MKGVPMVTAAPATRSALSVSEEQPMCDTDNRAELTAAEALPTSLEWKGEVLPLSRSMSYPY